MVTLCRAVPLAAAASGGIGVPSVVASGGASRTAVPLSVAVSASDVMRRGRFPGPGRRRATVRLIWREQRWPLLSVNVLSGPHRARAMRAAGGTSVSRGGWRGFLDGPARRLDRGPLIGGRRAGLSGALQEQGYRVARCRRSGRRLSGPGRRVVKLRLPLQDDSPSRRPPSGAEAGRVTGRRVMFGCQRPLRFAVPRGQTVSSRPSTIFCRPTKINVAAPSRRPPRRPPPRIATRSIRSIPADSLGFPVCGVCPDAASAVRGRCGGSPRPAACSTLSGSMTPCDLLRRGHPEGIDPLPRAGVDFGGLPQDERQDLVARGDFGETDVRFETRPLEIGDPLGGQGVVQVLGHRVWIDGHTPPTECWGAKPQLADHVTSATGQVRSEFTFLDLLADLCLVIWFKNLVQIGQHGT